MSAVLGQRDGRKLVISPEGATDRSVPSTQIDNVASKALAPVRLKLHIVKGFRKAEIAKLARSSFTAGSNVVSDGLSCWKSVEAAGCNHFPMSTGSGRKAAQWLSFNWVNTTLGNIKTALAGTYHHVSQKHAQRYLASFAWRFNRRFQLDALTERLTWAALQAKPKPYRVVIAG